MKTNHTWQMDGKAITVQIVLSDRKTSSIAVKPDMTIEFRGNVSTKWEDIVYVLDKKSALIRKKISFFEQFHPQPVEHKYESGETFYYLGRQYRLKVVESECNKVRLIGKWFIAEVRDITDKQKIKNLLDKWFREKAVKRISDRYLENQDLFKNRIKSFPDIAFRKMKKRWGSCSQNRILFNTELIKTPMICIDYIVVHELCHLLYHKHNKAFYSRLSRLMPDWKKRKDRLEHSNIS